MTGTNDKLRSLFLTALMVFSVFAGTIAFSGGAAAAANVGIEQATEYTANGGTNTIELALNDSTDTAVTSGDVDIWIDGNQNPSGYSTNIDPDNDGSDATNGRIAIGIGQDVQPNRNLTVRVDVTNGGQTSTLTAKDIDVTSRTFTPSGSDRTYTNVYRGEVIAIEDPNAANNPSVAIEEDGGSIVADDNYNDNSEVYTFDTEDLDTGQNYNITVDGSDEAGFRVSDLNLNVEMDDNDVTDEDDIIANVTIRRGGQPANATLFSDDDEKVKSIVKNLKGNDIVQFNFGNISDAEGFDANDGPYYVNVTDNQTGVTATSEQINVSEAQDGEVSFEDSVVSDERGDVVNITYELSNTDDGFIVIGDEDDDNYAISGQITDDDDDGEVTVQFNSYLAGTSANVGGVNANDVLSVAGDDDIENVNEYGSFERASLDEETLDASSYNMNATAGTKKSDNPDSVGTLRLEERSTESLRSWVAPQDADLEDEDIDIYDRIGANLTQANDIADGDIVVHQIVASGVEGPLAYEEDVNGSSDVTQAFLRSTGGDAGENDAFNFTVNRTNVGANADEDSMVLTSNNVTVVDDPDNNTYFVAVELDNVNQYESGTVVREDDEDDQITANFTVSKDTGLSDDNEGVEDDYTITDRDASLNTANGLVTVQAAADQPVSGTTTIAPGSEIEVRLDSESDANPFIIRPEATVTPNGTFTAMADMSDYSAGTNFTAQVLDVDGDELGDEEDGRITSAPTATVSISDQESDGSEVVVDSAQLSQGGFIAIHVGNASGDVIGHSEYLEAGSHEDITVTLDTPQDGDFTAVAMPHLDTNDNQAYDFSGGSTDGPYTSNGSAVVESANVTVTGGETPTEGPTPTDEPTQTEGPTEEPTTMAGTDEPTDEPGTTASEGPGFTAAIALIALIAAALLAVRRDN